MNLVWVALWSVAILAFARLPVALTIALIRFSRSTLRRLAPLVGFGRARLRFGHPRLVLGAAFAFTLLRGGRHRQTDNDPAQQSRDRS